MGYTDPERYYPKPPYVETKKCKAFRCKNRRTTSFPLVPNPPWCTDHARAVYFAGERWMHPVVEMAARKRAEPPTNIFTSEGRLATCQGIIENTQKKILHLRREQFNDIYTELKQLCELS